MTTAVQLTKNQRVSPTNQERFRDFLIRLRNGKNTLEDWALLSVRNLSKFIIPNTAPIRIAYTNSVVAENNYSMLMSLNKSV